MKDLICEYLEEHSLENPEFVALFEEAKAAVLAKAKNAVEFQKLFDDKYEGVKKPEICAVSIGWFGPFFQPYFVTGTETGEDGKNFSFFGTFKKRGRKESETDKLSVLFQIGENEAESLFFEGFAETEHGKASRYASFDPRYTVQLIFDLSQIEEPYFLPEELKKTFSDFTIESILPRLTN